MRSGVMSMPIWHCILTMYCFSSASVRSKSGKCTLASMTSVTRGSSGLVTRMSGRNAMVVAFTIYPTSSRA